MRVGIIRGDLPGPLFLADLEPTSQTNFPTEPAGQTRYVGRPNLTVIGAYLTAQGLSASASDLVTACLPVGGPLDVSSSTIKGVSGLGSATDDQVEHLANLMAPKFIDTDVAIKSFLIGNLAGYLSSSYVPDPSRHPEMTPGAAISVVQDDGVSAFVAYIPTISSATHNYPSSGDLTIVGQGLGDSEWEQVKVKVWNVRTGSTLVLTQNAIVRGGGTISSTNIFIPSALLGGLGEEGDKVQVLFTSLASDVQTTVND